MSWEKTALDIFIPEDRRQALSRGETLPGRTYGAVLFADISGFTKLTSVLSTELGAKRGAEELIRQIDPIYTDLVQAIHNFRGSVIVISGDGITCWFDQDDGRRATTCAFTMQAIMAQYETIRLPTGRRMNLGIKIAISVGPVRRFLVGDPDVQRIEALAGRQLDEVVAAQELLEKGEVAVSDKLCREIESEVIIRSYREIARGSRFAVIEQKKPLAQPDPWPEIPPLEEAVARQWVFASVYNRIKEEEIEFLTELRHGIPMFVKFTGLDYDNDEQAGEKLDRFIRRVQAVLMRYEGYLCQLTIGDKGSNLFIAFGAPVAHEDDMHRALSAALSLNEQTAELGFIEPLQISLTYGQLWAGAHGGRRARTYSVIGAEVNLAARLMSYAKPGQVLVSPHIAETTLNYSFAPLPAINLKGIAKPMPPFLLLGKARTQSVPVQQGRMYGREREQETLRQHLDQLLNTELSERRAVILIEGDAGIGKSVLLEDFIEKANQVGAKTFSGYGEPVERSTQYFAVRPIFEALFGMSDEDATSENQQKVFSAIQGDPFLLERVPLLGEVIPLRLPDNDLTIQMVGEARSTSIREFLLKVLQHMLFRENAYIPTVIMLDDAQWLDLATWNLIGYISRDLPRIQIAIGMRSIEPGELGAQNEEEYRRLREDPKTSYIRLQPLPEDEITGLLARKLRVKTLSPSILAFIQARAQGNPFFSEEIAYALRDAGVIQMQNGEAVVNLAAEELERIDFPQTIQGVITSRIDRLSPAHQLTLKVASVIGRVFLLNMLCYVHPSRLQMSTLIDYLTILTQLGITELEMPEPELAYLFKHVITQEVVYNLLTFAQRKQLHCAIAEWYEKNYSTDPSPYYPRLAHHWLKGEFREKAIHYLDKAAEQALGLYANDDVIRFISIAKDLDDEDWDPVDGGDISLARKFRLARWERMLATAHLNLGHLTEALEHFQEALRILGHPMPQTRMMLVLSMIKELAIQVWHRLRPAPENIHAPAAVREVDQEMARLAIDEVVFFSQDLPLLGWALLRRLNLAERARMTGPMAEGYSNLAMIAGFAQNQRLLALYRGLMWQAVEKDKRSSTRLYVLVRDGVSFFVGCHWKEAGERFAEGKKLAEQLGDTRNLALLTASNATSHLLQSRYRDSLEIWRENYGRAVKQDNPQELAWSLYGQGHNLLRMGDLDEAIRLLEASIATSMKNADDKALDSSRYGALSLAYFRKGEFGKSLEHLFRHQQVAPSRPAVSSTMQEYECVFDVMIGLWKKDQARQYMLQPLDRNQLQQALQRVPRILASLRANRVNKAKTYLYEGLHHELRDSLARARTSWMTCITISAQFQQPYEQARAHYELGLHLEGPSRVQHLEAAVRLFAEVHTPYELELARSALGQATSESRG